MAIVKPFRALRPPVPKAAQVASVPYDVVNTDEARTLAFGNELSFLHVSRPEIDLPEGTNLYSDEVYEKAKENFDKLKDKAPMLIEDDSYFYVYRLKMGNHEQTGVVACCSVDEYDTDIIRKHERTRRDKEDDRTRHMITLMAQTGPVFMTYRGTKNIDTLISEITQTEPLYDFTASDGIAHSIWQIPLELTAQISGAFAEVPLFYIADGHHRAASASRARATLRSGNSVHDGKEEYNFFQCVLFPADQLQILAYNRIVKELNGHSPESFMKAIKERFEVSESADPTPGKGSFSMYFGEKWYGLKSRGKVDASNPINSLDVSVLQDQLLAPILGIVDQRTDKRIDFVGGIRGTAELEKSVNTGRAVVAFSLFPTTVDDLMAIADAGEIMPPKSTWFEPKLRDGLLCHMI